MDEIFNKYINVNDKNTFSDKNQIIIKKLFLQMEDKIKDKKLTKKTVMRIYKFFLTFIK